MLRELGQTRKATSPFLGFGNPLIHGAGGNDRRAWQRQFCGGTAGAVQTASRRTDRSPARLPRGNLADAEQVRAQSPLPETADELCAVAASLGAGDDAVHLGAKATERAVKELSANGTLARARVLHFATHGLLASEAKQVAGSLEEPALLLTPPSKATVEDDGLLTASEVAQLKLDADWVVLSACNTAASSGPLNAEPLSGLARAFFYAGTRAILVSHWYVDSQAAVSLVTKTFAELEAKPGIGRAEALRRSMLALAKSSGPTAHPAVWAPFVVVGDGGR
jgi:CHAT domain-containing protein